MNWSVRPEPFATSDATRLRRDYYAEVAGRYWRRPAPGGVVGEGRAGDPPDRRAPPPRAAGGGRPPPRPLPRPPP
ncbi:hypothetical protein ACFXPP_04175, partial [Streptomyces sp. NPDC059134]